MKIDLEFKTVKSYTMSSSNICNVNITICAYSDVADLLKTNKYDSIISIKNPKKNDVYTDMELIRRYRRFKNHPNQSINDNHLLCMSFLDINVKHRKESPCNHHILRIIRLAEQLKLYMNDKSDISILIHCIAGISRSSASAIILLEELGYTTNNAISHVFKVRPIAVPNTLMLEIYRDYKEMTQTLDALITLDSLNTEKIDEIKEQ